MDKKKIKIKRDIAEKHYNAWLEAELAVANSQSYTIGSRSLTRANLAEIQDQIEYWESQMEKYDDMLENGEGRNRLYRAVPRDL